jgi:hypothetical protein
MAKCNTREDMPGWPRIASGIELIVWSNLASWNGTQLKATTNRDAFNAHWPKVDQRFGRWLCWVAFGVGAENVLKGAFGLKQYELKHFGASHPWKRVLQMPDEHVDFVSKAICLLATEVRNRDAHEYVPDVRNNDFPAVASQFVPALNHIFNCLGKENVARNLRQGF